MTAATASLLRSTVRHVSLTRDVGKNTAHDQSKKMLAIKGQRMKRWIGRPEFLHALHVLPILVAYVSRPWPVLAGDNRKLAAVKKLIQMSWDWSTVAPKMNLTSLTSALNQFRVAKFKAGWTSRLATQTTDFIHEHLAHDELIALQDSTSAQTATHGHNQLHLCQCRCEKRSLLAPSTCKTCNMSINALTLTRLCPKQEDANLQKDGDNRECWSLKRKAQVSLSLESLRTRPA